MRLPIVLCVATLVVSISAYSEPGAWERLTYYYLYTVDGMGKGPYNVAVGCVGTQVINGVKRRCSFGEFVDHIIPRNPDRTPTYTIDHSALRGLDLDRPDEAIVKIMNSKATLPYDNSKIFNSNKTPNDMLGTLECMNSFIYKRVDQISKLPEPLRGNLAKASRGLLKSRMEATGKAFDKFLGEKEKGLHIVTRQEPLWSEVIDLGADGVEVKESKEYADMPAYAASEKGGNTGLMKILVYQNEWFQNERDAAANQAQQNGEDPASNPDNNKHLKNIALAREGAMLLTETCDRV